MFEYKTVLESEKLVTIWEDAYHVIIQESEIIRKTTYFFKERRELLDKSINESENNILKFVSRIRLVFFLLISTICILSLRVIRPLFYIVSAIAEFLFHIILAIAKSLFYVTFFVIVQIGRWLIIMVVTSLKFMWELISSLVLTSLKFMWELISSLVLTPLKSMWELISSLVVKIKMLVSKMQ